MTSLKNIFLLLIVAVLASGCATPTRTDLTAMLQDNDVQGLEKNISYIQHSFEQGKLSEIELRNAFRPFYVLDPKAENNLRNWAQNSPNSYSAHLILGIYLKKCGETARGGKLISDTQKEKILVWERYLNESRIELNKSLKLTAKPYLSIFHLLDISISLGDKEQSKQLLAEGNRLYPNNSLVRNRYLTGLFPRWGGSYIDVDQFIEKSKAEGLNPKALLQLEALKYNDLGSMNLDNGNYENAKMNFEKALELGANVGGNFSTDFLPQAIFCLCRHPQTSTYCPADASNK